MIFLMTRYQRRAASLRVLEGNWDQLIIDVLTLLIDRILILTRFVHWFVGCLFTYLFVCLFVYLFGDHPCVNSPDRQNSYFDKVYFSLFCLLVCLLTINVLHLLIDRISQKSFVLPAWSAFAFLSICCRAATTSSSTPWRTTRWWWCLWWWWSYHISSYLIRNIIIYHHISSYLIISQYLSSNLITS